MNATSVPSLRVLVLGGYGFFGGRLVRRLAAHPEYQVLLAGRSLERGERFIAALKSTQARVRAIALDATDPELAAKLKASQAQVLVHTAGPFQGQDYHVARACIEAGVHYIDLADGRDFVSRIDTLNDAAQRAGVCVYSGASSVPALSGAVVDALLADLGPDFKLTHIDIGIHPGNRTERGLATMEAILTYVGRPIRVWREGAWTTVPGWSKHWRHSYPKPVGMRWTAPCDVPDLELFPARYAPVRTVRFGAGLELNLLHGGLALLASLRRMGLVPNPVRFASALKAVSECFMKQGSDAGGMYVSVFGTNAQGNKAQAHWHLIAERGDGPYVPTLAAAALLKRFAHGKAPAPGAGPCVGILELNEFKEAARGLAIRMGTARDNR